MSRTSDVSTNGTLADGTAAAAIAGDRDAIAALWRANRRWIAAVLLAHKCAEDSLEDLLQDVAMTVVGKISTVREPAHVRAWLRTVAVNTARASARSARARPWLRTSRQIPDDCAEPGRDGVPDDEARRLMQAARALPDTYREPLLLRALHGMRGRQIAALLGVAEPTVETRIARARRMVRERLEEASTSTTHQGNQP